MALRGVKAKNAPTGHFKNFASVFLRAQSHRFAEQHQATVPERATLPVDAPVAAVSSSTLPERTDFHDEPGLRNGTRAK